MTQTRLRLALGGACLLALVATACGDDDNVADSGADSTISTVVTDAGAAVAPAATDAASAVATPPVVGLTIENSTFSAASVVAGTAFTIANNDDRDHTVTDDGGAFDVAVPGGGTGTMTITAPGTYQIHCKIHGSMQGTITVS